MQLVTFITRFIWLTVQHSANSAPLLPNGAYVPIAPTKLYYDPRVEAEINYAYNLPNATAAMVGTVTVLKCLEKFQKILYKLYVAVLVNSSQQNTYTQILLINFACF